MTITKRQFADLLERGDGGVRLPASAGRAAGAAVISAKAVLQAVSTLEHASRGGKWNTHPAVKSNG